MQTISKSFIILLAMMTAISPLAIDVYLPSFHTISSTLNAPLEHVEVTISIYLLGFALGQLLGGSLSDRYGRKPFIYAGLFLYMLFSFLISLSPSIEFFWLFRFFQALGGGLSVVNTGAVVRDLYQGKEAAQVFSIISMVIMLAPMLAPVLGAGILLGFSWEAIFIFLSLYALFLLFFVTKLPETSPKNKKSTLFGNYKLLLQDKDAMLIIFVGCFGISGLFVFITKASFIYMEHFHVTSLVFALLFSLNGLAIMVASRLNMFLLKNHTPLTILKRAILFQVLTSLSLIAVSFIDNLYLIATIFALHISTLGFIFGNVFSLLLDRYGHISASASAFNGLFGFLVAAVIGFIASRIEGLQPLFYLLTLLSITAFLLILWIQRRQTRES